MVGVGIKPGDDALSIKQELYCVGFMVQKQRIYSKCSEQRQNCKQKDKQLTAQRRNVYILINNKSELYF